MPNKKPSKTNYRKIAAISSLGLMLPSSIAVGLFFGYMLDKLLGAHPPYSSVKNWVISVK